MNVDTGAFEGLAEKVRELEQRQQQVTQRLADEERLAEIAAHAAGAEPPPPVPRHRRKDCHLRLIRGTGVAVLAALAGWRGAAALGAAGAAAAGTLALMPAPGRPAGTGRPDPAAVKPATAPRLGRHHALPPAARLYPARHRPAARRASGPVPVAGGPSPVAGPPVPAPVPSPTASAPGPVPPPSPSPVVTNPACVLRPQLPVCLVAP